MIRQWYIAANAIMPCLVVQQLAFPGLSSYIFMPGVTGAATYSRTIRNYVSDCRWDKALMASMLGEEGFRTTRWDSVANGRRLYYALMCR